MDYEQKYKDMMLVEQNAILQELKALHLRMERQTVCNDAGGNRMWRRAWQHINEAINIIPKELGDGAFYAIFDTEEEAKNFLNPITKEIVKVYD